MTVNATIKFNFNFVTSRAEIQDIIEKGDYFPENVVDCEVIFHE